MTDFSKLLNPEQCATATAGEGPILVLAAAGTGKQGEEVMLFIIGNQGMILAGNGLVVAKKRPVQIGTKQHSFKFFHNSPKISI